MKLLAAAFLVWASIIQCKAALDVNGSSLVHGLLDVLPKDRVESIELEHLENDEGFKAAILYMQGEEWRSLVDKIVASEEYSKFAEMALKYKLNISQIITCLRTHVESLKIEKTTAKPNLEPFIIEIQTALPVDKIVKLLSNSDNPEALRIRQEVGTKENQKVAEKLYDLPEMVKLRAILKDMHFDVEPYIALLFTFLGWVH